MARGDIERSIGSRKLVLATRNRHKIVLYSEAFRFYGWETVGIEQLGLDGHVEENAQTAEATPSLKLVRRGAKASLFSEPMLDWKSTL